MAKRKQSDQSSHVADINCPHCDGTGYVIGDDGARPCECLETRQSNHRLRRSKIPPRFMGKSLKSFETARSRERKAIRDLAQSYVKAFNPATLDPAKFSSNGLLLIGAVGSGKTHIAVAALREVIERGHTGLFCNVVDLLDDLRASYNPQSSQSGWEILEQIEKADLVVLDDLGAEAPTGWVLDRLYQIINRRYEENRPTIVTSNLSLEELSDQIGTRITSRLCEMCQVVPFPDVDWRRKKMMENSV